MELTDGNHPQGCRARESSESTVSVFSCSADGNYEVTLMTKATVYYNGLVVWQPPAVYKSSCAIDVEFFPYDVQTCVLKLGSWTYDGFKVRVVFLLTGVCLENCAPCTYRLFTLGKGIKLTKLTLYTRALCWAGKTNILHDQNREIDPTRALPHSIKFKPIVLFFI